jgi:pre-mRNA-splicing factor 18
MNALKELLEKKRKALPATTFGEKKFIKQSELEELRLKRLREEEEREKEEKVRASRFRQRQQDTSSPSSFTSY